MGHHIARKGVVTLVAMCAGTLLSAAPGLAAPGPATAGLTAAGPAVSGSTVAGPTVAGPTAAGPTAAGVATRIVLERSGGFGGGQESFVVDRSTAGGHSALRLAGSRAFRSLHRSYEPANPCCDRFSYRVTVSYRGGDHKTVAATQGAPAPDVLWEVIDKVERVGVHPVTAPPAAR